MRRLRCSLLLSVCVVFGCKAQSPAAVEAARVPAHVVNSFDLTVPLAYPEAARLFGPEGERPWSEGKWDPQFVYPQPARDIQGAVFTIHHGPHTAVWVNTLFDLQAKHVQYVYVVPDVQTATIDVFFRPLNPHVTAVHVAYARTALSAEGNELVNHQGETDRNSGPQWQKAIEAMLHQKQTP